MTTYKDVGHPMGWLVCQYGSGELMPRWIGKRKTHRLTGDYTNKRVVPLAKPGPVRIAYALGSTLSKAWHGYNDPNLSWDSNKQPFNYIAWCMFWSVPIVELTRAVLSGQYTQQQKARLHEILDKIPDHPPLTLGHRQPSVTGATPEDQG